jgi:chromosome segregation ATPase
MPFTKTHPQNSWQAEHEMACNYVRDTQAHLNSLQAQLDECAVHIASAETIIEMLEPQKDRRIQAELVERKKQRNRLQTTKGAIEKSFATVEERLQRHQARLDEFPLAELKKEQTLHNARHNAGSLPAGPGLKSFEGGTVSSYGG